MVNNVMNGRERIQKVMNFEIPDRVPFDGLMPARSDIFYMPMLPSKSWQPPDEPNVYPKVVPEFIKARLWKWKPKSWVPPSNWHSLPRKELDPFGCVWEYAENDATKGHPGAGEPMNNFALLDSWRFPDPYDASQYRFFSRVGRLFWRKYKVALLDSLIYARVQYLRGFTPSLTDMRKNATPLKQLIAKLKDYYLGAIEMWHKFGADAVYGQDDMGAQNEPFMSPRMYKEFYAPAYKELAQRAHELGMKFILHSCGHVNDLIPIWIDCGIDALQFDSPRMTGLDFDAQFAGKIVFHMVPDIQQVYPFASIAELESEIKQMIQKCGQAGGLVIRDYMRAVKVLNVPQTNYEALPKLVAKWGSYPLSWT
jgi:hypothetical protein